MRFDFSWERMWAIVAKEFKEMRHDPITAIMIIMIPLVQILLFAYTINNDPKHLPTVIVSADESIMTRDIINELQLSTYFQIMEGFHSPDEADHLLKTGAATFAIYFPANFTRDLIRGDKPQILIEADATDPAAVGYALSAFNQLSHIFFANFTGTLDFLRPNEAPIDVNVHPKYNPNRITQYNIVPGLLSAVLSMTMVLVTALAVVREREVGTLEVLLTTPLRPMEIIIGKIIPYIVIAYLQAMVILLLAHFLFHIPVHGSVLLLLSVCFPFILANLVLGITFSSLCSNQMQAAQATSFYFLPSLLFSGFMFPFHGLPRWGQLLGELLPSTHFLRIVRGIMLKGSGLYDIYPDLIAIFIFFFVFLIFSVSLFRQTLD